MSIFSSTSKRISTVFFTPLILGALLTGCSQDDAQEPEATVIRPVKTLKVSSITGQLRKTYSAIVLPSQQVKLSFRVSGKIIELPIENGMEVKEGDVIAQLDKRDFKAEISRLKSQIKQAVAQTEALKSGARSEDVTALVAAVSAEQAKVNAAQAEFNRTQSLVDKQLIARATLDKDRSTLKIAEADLNVKKQELKKGRSGGRKEDIVAQNAVNERLRSQLKSLEDTLDDTTLRTPFDGVIATRTVENFSNIQAKESVVTLQALGSEVDLVFDIPSSDIVILAKKELNSIVILDSFPNKEFKADKRGFSTEVDVATQTYQGRVFIKPEKGEPILPGMTGRIIISGNVNADDKAVSNTFMLPVSAITSEAGGKPFIWIVNTANNTTSKRSVVLGEASGGSITVVEGLKDSDVVVTAGVSALQDNMMVKPITAIGQ